MIESLREERLKKLNNLKAAGIDPYPAKSKRTHVIAEAIKGFGALSKSNKKIFVVGRIRSIRGQGGISFMDLKDESGAIQVVVKKDVFKDLDFWRDNLDIGDFIEVSGILFKTKRGEKSIELRTIKILSKSLRPIPSEYYGVNDIETRLRKRYLDFLGNPETKELFRKKSIFWAETRRYLENAGFLEVETPILEPIPGGAEAEPFVTHHNALDQDFYLRISPELNLKRLMVGGFEKVFEIGRIFRNEGIDAEHLQDYTQMEMYWTYQDYEGLMKFIESLYKHVIKKTFGTLKLKHGEKTIDWGKKWKRLDYYKLFYDANKIDLNTATVHDLEKCASQKGIDFEPGAGRGRLIDLIYKKTVRPNLIEPSFLINTPVDIEPLAKRMPGDPTRVERFQPVAYGTELGKGFSELNDPLDQRGRFEEQMKLREAGDKEAQMLDEDYVEAMEYGMPPTAGFAYSERLFAVLVGLPVREAVIFPLMRHKKTDK